MNKDDGIGPKTRQVRQSSIGWMMKPLCASLDSEMQAKLQQVGLNINQFAVIMTLLEQEGLTQAEIGSKIEMPGYATTRTLDALEGKQVIERRADERSRRSHRVFLTERGRVLAPDLFGIVQQVNARLLSPLKPREQEQLSELLMRLFRARFPESSA